jgi:hypothetical protein
MLLRIDWRLLTVDDIRFMVAPKRARRDDTVEMAVSSDVMAAWEFAAVAPDTFVAAIPSAVRSTPPKPTSIRSEVVFWIPT